VYYNVLNKAGVWAVGVATGLSPTDPFADKGEALLAITSASANYPNVAYNGK